MFCKPLVLASRPISWTVWCDQATCNTTQPYILARMKTFQKWLLITSKMESDTENPFWGSWSWLGAITQLGRVGIFPCKVMLSLFQVKTPPGMSREHVLCSPLTSTPSQKRSQFSIGKCRGMNQMSSWSTFPTASNTRWKETRFSSYRPYSLSRALLLSIKNFHLVKYLYL